MPGKKTYNQIRRAAARPRVMLGASALGAILIAAACGGGGVKYGSSSAPATPADPMPMAAGGPTNAMHMTSAAPLNPADMSAGPAGGAAAAVPAKGAVKVTIANFAFSPSIVTVPVGATVTWINQDSVAHTVTSTNQRFDSAELKPGQQFSYTFTKAGSYAYFCTIHPAMTGTVIVQ